jgi:hypothetical protein
MERGRDVIGDARQRREPRDKVAAHRREQRDAWQARGELTDRLGDRARLGFVGDRHELLELIDEDRAPVPIEQRVMSDVDLAHAAPAELPHEPVLVEIIRRCPSTQPRHRARHPCIGRSRLESVDGFHRHRAPPRVATAR